MVEEEPRIRPYARVPQELRVRSQWVVWRPEDERKVPLNVRTLGNAGVTWPNTWGSFEEAREVAAYEGLGLGFVLTEEDPYTAVDLDHCVGEQGNVNSEIRAILDLLSGWVELSPSGSGLHVFVRNLKPINRRTKGIEIYSHHRWMTITGRSNPQARHDIPERTEEVEALIQRYFPQPERTILTPRGIDYLADDEIWQRLFGSQNGAFFESLFAGDLSVCYDDHSRAVILLANQLAMLTDLDAARIKRLLYQTELVNPKWEERRGSITWIDYQILDAIAYVSGRKR